MGYICGDVPCVQPSLSIPHPKNLILGGISRFHMRFHESRGPMGVGVRYLWALMVQDPAGSEPQDNISWPPRGNFKICETV